MVFGSALLRGGAAERYLPWQHHWDEITNVGVGQDMADELSVDPGFYDYPAGGPKRRTRAEPRRRYPSAPRP